MEKGTSISKNPIDELYDNAFKIFNNNLGYYKWESILRTVFQDGKTLRWGASAYSFYSFPESGFYNRYEYESIDGKYLKNANVIRIEKKIDGVWTSIWELKEHFVSDPDTIILIQGEYYTLDELNDIVKKVKNIKEI